jgi:hypothetical protein
MRRIRPFFAMVLVAAIGAVPAVAQDVGETVSITGCLAQEDDDGESELVLTNGAMGETMFEEVDLIPGEGVNAAPHVGHTVEVTGVVIEDPDEADEAEEDEAEEDDDDDGLHVRVTGLRHVAGSCEGGLR